MKKVVYAVLIIATMIALCACGDEKESEQAASLREFQDITLSLSDDINMRSFEEMEEYEMYSAIFPTMSNEEGFVDEKLLIGEEVWPVAIYCVTLNDPTITIEDLISYAYENQDESMEIEETSVDNITAVRVTFSQDGSGGSAFYSQQLNFIIDGKLYELYTSAEDSVTATQAIDNISSLIRH